MVGTAASRQIRSRTFSVRTGPPCLSTRNTNSILNAPPPPPYGPFFLAQLTRVHHWRDTTPEQHVESVFVDGIVHIKVYRRIEDDAVLGVLFRGQLKLKRQKRIQKLENLWRLNYAVDCSRHQTFGVVFVDAVGVLFTTSTTAHTKGSLLFGPTRTFCLTSKPTEKRGLRRSSFSICSTR